MVEDDPFSHHRLGAKVIKENILRRHSQTIKEVNYRLRHHWRTAHKVDDALWLIVVFEICLVENIVNETSNIWYTSLISLWIWTVEGQVELEVRELLLDLVVVVEIECLLQRACAIEEVNLTTCFKGLEEVHNV